jgi:Flp pilus assembly protein TadG
MDNQRKSKPRRGTAILECAFILPLLLLLTFGGLKYGWLFIKWQQTTNVARHAVRHAVRPAPNPTPSALIGTLMDNAGMGSSGYSSSITGGASVGDQLTVQISVPVANVDILDIPLLPAPTTLTATMTMSKEGPGS